MSKDYLRMGGI
jgi:ATP-dependent RNA helicase DDX24/MAK5